MSKAQQIYSPSEDEKKRAVPVGFCYSCDQVIGIIQTGFLYNPAVGQVVKNACLESMLIHVRILLDFFEHKTRRASTPSRSFTDVLAVDFGFPVAIVGISKDCCNRLDKDLAHLTYESLNRPAQEKEWQCAGLTPLLHRCVEFLDFLEKKKPIPWDETLAALRGQIKQCVSMLGEA